MKTIRSFLAVNLDVRVAREIAIEQRKFRDLLEDEEQSIKWVPPQNQHVTIRFLGKITEPMVGAIKDSLKPVTRSTAPFNVSSNSLGAFPSIDDPKTLWTGISDETENLAKLYDKVCNVLETTGFKSDDKPFNSHVTIGRIKGAVPPNLAEILERGAKLDFGRSKITNLVCYRSDLTSKGSDYHILWSLPLTGKERQDYKPANRYNAPNRDTQEQRNDESE